MWKFCNDHIRAVWIIEGRKYFHMIWIMMENWWWNGLPSCLTLLLWIVSIVTWWGWGSRLIRYDTLRFAGSQRLVTQKNFGLKILLCAKMKRLWFVHCGHDQPQNQNIAHAATTLVCNILVFDLTEKNVGFFFKNLESVCETVSRKGLPWIQWCRVLGSFVVTNVILIR